MKRKKEWGSLEKAIRKFLWTVNDRADKLSRHLYSLILWIISGYCNSSYKTERGLQSLMRSTFFRSLLVTYCCIKNDSVCKLLETIINILFHIISRGQEFGSNLAGKFWFRVIRDVVVQGLTRPVVIWGADWGWRDPFQDSSLTWLARCCWPSAGGFSPLPGGPLFAELLECPHNMAAGFPQGRRFKTSRQSSNDF